MWVVVCLGIEPLVYGLFTSAKEAENWLVGRHCTEYTGDPNLEPLCANGIVEDDHHILGVQDVRRT